MIGENTSNKVFIRSGKVRDCCYWNGAIQKFMIS